MRRGLRGTKRGGAVGREAPGRSLAVIPSVSYPGHVTLSWSPPLYGEDHDRSDFA